MSLLRKLDLDRPSAARIWSAIDPETRILAARALYGSGDAAHRAEADASIAERMRFRLASVRKLPVEKRVGYIARGVVPDESLAADLLLALHMGGRRKMLAAFLDALEIPNADGTIDEDHELTPPDPGDLRKASDELSVSFPVEEVDLYLACLWAMDNRNWGGLEELLRERAGD